MPRGFFTGGVVPDDGRTFVPDAPCFIVPGHVCTLTVNEEILRPGDIPNPVTIVHIDRVLSSDFAKQIRELVGKPLRLPLREVL